jgi:small subunit ribosomal protein S14
MAKKSSIARNQKRQALERKYHVYRKTLKQSLKEASSVDMRWAIQQQLQSLPRNSAPTRIHRRCALSGRPKAVYRDFGFSRHVVREMAHACLLPGVTKSSW